MSVLSREAGVGVTRAHNGTGAQETSACRLATESGGGNENLDVIQTWFNSGSGMEAGVSQRLVSIVRRGD
jgi:hypothetical protein